VCWLPRVSIYQSQSIYHHFALSWTTSQDNQGLYCECERHQVPSNVFIRHFLETSIWWLTGW
jgi:hypothetical protein